MSKYIKYLPVLLVVIIQMAVRHCNAYCWQSGWNPNFISEPKVEQLTMMKVRVSWDGIVDKRKCADSFLVKYWRKSSPATYKMTTPVPTQVSYEDIEISPKVIYLYQVIAREDKGMILGVDYNKAKPVEFRTSPNNEEISSDNSNVPGGIINNNNHGRSQSTYNPKINDKAINVMGLTIETLVIMIVVGLILVLVIIGLVYKFACGGKKSSKYDEEEDDEESGEGEDDEEESDEDQWDVRFGPKEAENESLQSNQNSKQINRNFSHKNSNGLNYRSNLKEV